ncbi:FACT complex subunit spt16 [Hanseniaspora vineae]
MSELDIKPDLVKKRLVKLHNEFSSFDSNPETLIFPLGSTSEDRPYQKTSTLHQWLLGYEFPATMIVFTKTKVIFITSNAKAKHLSFLEEKNGDIAENLKAEVWKRNNKDPQHNTKLFQDVVALLEPNSTVGMLLKDQYEGSFMNEWNPVWDASKSKYQVVDCSLGLSKVLEVKDSVELELLRVSAKCSDFFISSLNDDLIRNIDEETKITNARLADNIDGKIENPKFLKELNSNLRGFISNSKDVKIKFDINNVDWAYSPVIQSGDQFDLRISARSTNKQLQGHGSILASCGLKYSNYCTNISRTFLIDPSEEITGNYEFLLTLQKEIVNNYLKVGNTPKQVYDAAIEYINKNKPELAASFSKNIGSILGLDIRDAQFVLSTKNDYRTIHANDVFNISLGFNNLTDSKSNKPYAVQIADTVLVGSESNTVLTTYPKSKTKISFFFNNEEEDDEYEEKSASSKNGKKNNVKSEQNKKLELLQQGNTKILRSKLRNQSNNEDVENQRQVRRENQKKLHEKLQRDGLLRYSKTASGSSSDDSTPVFKKYESYVRDSQIPSSVRDLKIHVDWKNQTIILPIFGRPVPFHINSYKNGSKVEEGEYTYLRLNFNSPGISGASKKSKEIPYEDSPENQFVRSITLRSKDDSRMSDIFKQISELKKESTKRDQEKKAMADVVQQAKLIEFKGGRTKRLDQVFVRPSPDTKRVPGSVAIHENGIRYQSPLRSESRIDILFSNIKNLFFQSCKGELIVIIHVHLKNPILMGKKKVQDIQFYREATDMAVDETGNSRKGNNKFRRYGDEDELEQEQEEKRKRAALDKEFKIFADAISDASNGYVDVDSPFKELGFQGVPGRSAVLCMPTRDCLIQLVEPPFLVVNLNEVEICCLERVQFGLKNFDLVFVYKDFNKAVTHVNTIPIEDLDVIKSWLTDVDIPYTVSTINLNWVNILKTDPHDFFIDGGWGFLPVGSDIEADDSDMEEEEISEYEASDDDPQDESDFSGGSDEDDDEDAYSDEGSDFSGGDESEEGEDWDELEKKAARADKKGEFRD